MKLTKVSPATELFHGRKNFLINGNFDVWQRGESFNVPTNAYTTDRWICRGESLVGGTVNTNKSTFSDGAQCIESTHANATEVGYIVQRIEGLYLEGKTVTLSFDYEFSAANTNIHIELVNRKNNVEFSVAPDVSIAQTGSKTRFTVTLTVPTHTETISLANDSIFVAILYYNQSIVVNDGTYKFGKVQLEEGTVATEFDQRSYADELLLCQRYYQHSWPIGYNPGSDVSAISYAAGNHTYFSALTTRQNTRTVTFNVPMRSLPSAKIYSTAGTINKIYTDTAGDVDINVNVFSNKQMFVSTVGAVTAYNWYAYNYEVTAEL